MSLLWKVDAGGVAHQFDLEMTDSGLIATATNVSIVI